MFEFIAMVDLEMVVVAIEYERIVSQQSVPLNYFLELVIFIFE